MYMPATDPAPTKAGQPAEVAIEALYEEQSEAIFHLGLDLLRGDPEAARDLVQETFLSALEAWDGFEGNAKASTWLYTIARRTAWRMRRLRAGEPRHMDSFSEETHAVEAEREEFDDPLEALIREEEERRLYVALGALPIRYRLPVSLKEIGGLSVADVADALHLNEGTVKSRLYRGRDRLAALLESVDDAASTSRASRSSDGRPSSCRSDTLCPQCREVFGDECRADRVCELAESGDLSREFLADLGFLTEAA